MLSDTFKNNFLFKNFLLNLISQNLRRTISSLPLHLSWNIKNIYLFVILGKTYELPIKDGAINATDLGKIKSETGAVTRSYDPAYMNTVNCISRISFIDGDVGILEYRGYPIE